MKFFLLILVIIALSSMPNNDALAGTVFSWLDENGVMHFTDKKPPEVEVESDKLTSKTVQVTNILESYNATPNNINENKIPETSQTNMMSKSTVDEQTDTLNSSINETAKQQPTLQQENMQMTTNEDKQPIAILELSNKTAVVQ